MTDPEVIKIPELDEETGITNSHLLLVLTPLGGGLFSSEKITFANLLPSDIITTARIINGAITNAKLGDYSISTTKLQTASVGTVKLIDAAVETAKIKDANVTAAKLAADAVETAKIKDANVTTDKIAPAAVTTPKLDIPCARVLKSGNQWINFATGAKLTGWTSDYDNDAIWDNANNQFKIKTAGVYQITINGICSLAADLQVRFAIAHDGNDIWMAQHSRRNASGTPQRFSLTGQIKLDVDDTVYVYIYNDSGDTGTGVQESTTYDSRTQYTWFAINWISSGD